MKPIVLNNVFKEYYAINEAYKSLRTNLLFCGADIKVITITSCLAGEGKSSMTIELSKNLAAAGKKVLLLDADLRKSTVVSKYTMEKNVLGLSQYLSGQATLEEVLYTVANENVTPFDIVFAGQYPPNPVDLLSSEIFKKLLEYGREHYDFVLIDTPPLGLVIDSAVVCALSDGAVLVIHADRISYRFAQEVKEQIERSGCRVLGAILNQIESNRSGYYRYYSGRYYSYRGYGKYYRSYGYGKRYGYGRYGKYGYGNYSYGNYGVSEESSEKGTASGSGKNGDSK